MTTAIFLIACISLIITGLNLLPVANTVLNSNIETSIFYFVKILKGWNWLFAIDTLLTCFGIIITYELLIWSWFKIISPLIKLIRGSTH